MIYSGSFRQILRLVWQVKHCNITKIVKTEKKKNMIESKETLLVTTNSCNGFQMVRRALYLLLAEEAMPVANVRLVIIFIKIIISNKRKTSGFDRVDLQKGIKNYGSLYLVCNDRKAFFTSSDQSWYTLWSCQNVCDTLSYLLDNIYIRFGTKLYRQIVGIPMGTNCAPLVADLFFF